MDRVKQLNHPRANERIQATVREEHGLDSLLRAMDGEGVAVGGEGKDIASLNIERSSGYQDPLRGYILCSWRLQLSRYPGAPHTWNITQKKRGLASEVLLSQSQSVSQCQGQG
jgi:hypothetical protein